MPRTNRPTNGRGNRGDGEPFNDRDAIARRAYEIYQSRGAQHGADLDDWLEAERQLKPGPSDVTGPAPARSRKRKTSSEQTGL
jgi:hypothetical protein